MQDNKVKDEATNIKPKKGRGCLISIIIIIGLLMGSIIYASKNADRLGATPAGSIMVATNMSKEQATEIITVLEKCGISKMVDLKHDEMLDNMNFDGEKGYRLKVDNIENIILYISKDNKVSMVRWADNTLYEKGKVISKITDYFLTDQEASNLQIKCQNAVKAVLKSPSTAKFPNILNWKFSKNKERIIVQSYVDSQNSFGAEIRGEFQITISPTGDKITSFIFEGKEYMK